MGVQVVEATNVCLAESAAMLSERQREIARLVAHCLSNKEIALACGVRETTVKSHLRDISRVLGTQSRQDLALYMVVGGLVSTDEVASFLLPRIREVARINDEEIA